jgi:putative nucleotidyltransferase with HDIG domain
MIPSVEECFRLMKRHEMLDNIKAHSIVVEKIAIIIARGLRDAGVDLSLEKVTAGALMHDIGKTICFQTGGDHAAVGEEICLQHGLEEIADIVGEHVRLKSYAADQAISEKEIVYYADKRVNHDEVVGLEERLEYLFIRYGNNEEYRLQLIKDNIDLCKEVEIKLFTELKFGPEELSGMIE